MRAFFGSLLKIFVGIKKRTDVISVTVRFFEYVYYATMVMYREDAQPSRIVPLGAVYCTRHQPSTLSSTFRLEPFGILLITDAEVDALVRNFNLLPFVLTRAFADASGLGAVLGAFVGSLSTFRYFADT